MNIDVMMVKCILKQCYNKRNSILKEIMIAETINISQQCRDVMPYATGHKHCIPQVTMMKKHCHNMF